MSVYDRYEQFRRWLHGVGKRPTNPDVHVDPDDGQALRYSRRAHILSRYGGEPMPIEDIEPRIPSSPLADELRRLV